MILKWLKNFYQKKTALIAKSRHELLQVFDGFDDPVVVIDKQFVIQRVNRGTLATLQKKSFGHFIGKSCYKALHGLEERCPQCTAPLTFSSGEKTTRFGFLKAREHPLETSYSITCYPLTNKKGEVTSVAEYYRDASEITKLSRELYESERTRVMEPLASGLAHQIRQPLTIIRAAAQYTLETFKKTLPGGDFEETMGSIIQNVDTINEVLMDLLHFSKPSSYQMEKGSITKLLEQGLRLVRHQIKTKKIAVTKEWEKSLPDLLMDEKLFLQAYLNLLVNAVEATPPGGSLAVRAFLENQEKPCQMTIVIEDTGRGIPREMVSRLFHPFFSTKEGGVGLGLPVAEGIIRSHGGQIRFESSEGNGTKVVIELPMAS